MFYTNVLIKQETIVLCYWTSCYHLSEVSVTWQKWFNLEIYPIWNIQASWSQWSSSQFERKYHTSAVTSEVGMSWVISRICAMAIWVEKSSQKLGRCASRRVRSVWKSLVQVRFGSKMFRLKILAYFRTNFRISYQDPKYFYKFSHWIGRF